MSCEALLLSITHDLSTALIVAAALLLGGWVDRVDCCVGAGWRQSFACLPVAQQAARRKSLFFGGALELQPTASNPAPTPSFPSLLPAPPPPPSLLPSSLLP